MPAVPAQHERVLQDHGQRHTLPHSGTHSHAHSHSAFGMQAHARTARTASRTLFKESTQGGAGAEGVGPACVSHASFAT